MSHAVHYLQRDWVNAWPRYWPEKSYAFRRGFQAGVNHQLGTAATRAGTCPARNPYDSGTAETEAWALGYSNGTAHAEVMQKLSDREATHAST